MRGAILLLLAGGCSGAFPAMPDASDDTSGDDDDAPTTGPTVLPFAVDDWYGPSGYMGDGESPGAIADAQTCRAGRPSTWMGNCHRYTWTPADRGWGGVYWQYPDGNWGDQLGLEIPSGATRVTFRAWGATGGEKVDFMVGMMAVDGFEAKTMDLVLGTEPEQYTIELGDAAITRVVGGFGWFAKDSTSAVVFGLDDIRWE